MKGFFLTATVSLVAFFTFTGVFQILHRSEPDIEPPVFENTGESYREITGVIKAGETLYDIFKRYGLDIRDLFLMRKASTGIHRLRNISADSPYKLMVDEQNHVHSFNYSINDDLFLNITRNERGFIAEKIEVEYERRIGQIGGVISDNLIASIGEGRERLSLALNLSDIFAWDIDFTTDLRNGDTFKVIAEELYQDNEFKRYGNILAAEFVNNGKGYRAYRFEHNGEAGYYDDEGNTLKRAFLKAPLSFRRISSGFSKSRLHPVLKRYRPHHGIDYAAPSGTPVSAVGDGTATFSGYKGDYGKLVIIRHPNGYKTYYGHLSRIGKGIARGVKVRQEDVIGYVGSTGLATGPHLHYEMRVNNKPLNPLRIKVAKGKPLPEAVLAEFSAYSNHLSKVLASIMPENVVAAKDNRRGAADGV
ncbi:MAG: peptidoglycan DD-metalloendopeptidase family protein [Syntrophales bacterium]|nr:peptidoglycan DD-metalloendopeptidase family protein [Syntrophales bacterium]